MMREGKLKITTEEKNRRAIINYFIENNNERSIKSDIAKGCNLHLSNITHLIDKVVDDGILQKFESDIAITGAKRDRYNLNENMDYEMFKDIVDIYFINSNEDRKSIFFDSIFRQEMTAKGGFMKYICDSRNIDFPKEIGAVITFLIYYFVEIFEESLYCDDLRFKPTEKIRTQEEKFKTGQLFLNKTIHKIMDIGLKDKISWPMLIDYIVTEYIIELKFTEEIKLLSDDERTVSKVHARGTIVTSSKKILESVHDGKIILTKPSGYIDNLKETDDLFSDPPADILNSFFIEELRKRKDKISKGNKELRKAFKKVIKYLEKHPIIRSTNHY